MMTRLTLITGADRGMGFETAKELGQKGQHILLGARNEERGQAAVDQLRALGITADLVVIDVTDEATIQAAVQQVTSDFGHLDILINNAGIALDNYERASTLPVATIRQDFDVNFFGLVAVTQAFIPLLRQSQDARIINISSAVGSLTLASDPTTSIYRHSAMGYQASKSAVNLFTVDLANDLQADHISVNAVNPGWVATDSPVGGGPKTVEEGVARTIELATASTNDVTGTFSDTDGIVPW